MWKWMLEIVLLAAVTLPAAAQMGKQVTVQEGTPEDHELTAIEAATNPRQKLALLDKFSAAHPAGDMALMADNIYVDLYSSLRNYAMAYQFGDKALALDPFDLDVAVQLVRDAQLQNNIAKMVTYALRVGKMVADFKAQPPPAGIPADQWALQQKQTLASVQAQVNWVAQSAYALISSERPSSAKTAQLSELEKTFPNSSYSRAKK